MTVPGIVLARLDLLDGLVHARVEGPADRRNAGDSLAAERVDELALDHRQPLGHRLDVARPRRALDGALEVVEDRQEGAQQIFPAVASRFFELPTSALAEVVEIRGGPQQRVLQPRRLRLHLGERLTGSLARGRRPFAADAGGVDGASEGVARSPATESSSGPLAPDSPCIVGNINRPVGKRREERRRSAPAGLGRSHELRRIAFAVLGFAAVRARRALGGRASFGQA